MANESMGLIGRKVGMTQFFRDDGAVVPVTLIEAGPCTVLQVKTADGADGYNAIQIGFGTQKSHRITRPQRGHFDKAGQGVAPRYVKEIRLSSEDVGKYQVGQTLSLAEVFEVGQKVDVTGTSKGRGFAGVMKRHNFRGFIRTHGTHEFFRHGGSIGTRLTPGMVLKGKSMPGHMGSERVTVQNLALERVDADKNLLFVKGGVPGPNGGLLVVRRAVKARA
jgi:large subunit ribosomal protein L3